jgi:hypothetical protein
LCCRRAAVSAHWRSADFQVRQKVCICSARVSRHRYLTGRIRAHITTADARLDQVAANYEKTFLLALEDTENAFVPHTSALERRDQLILAETTAERSHAHAHAFYQRGAADFLSYSTPSGQGFQPATNAPRLRPRYA